MDAWDVVVVGGTVAGLRAAISAHDAGSSVLVLEEGAIGSGGSSTSVEGLAASINESNNKILSYTKTSLIFAKHHYVL